MEKLYRITIHYVNGDTEDLYPREYEEFEKYKKLFKTGLKMAKNTPSFGVNLYHPEDDVFVTDSYNVAAVRKVVFLEPYKEDIAKEEAREQLQFGLEDEDIHIV